MICCPPRAPGANPGIVPPHLQCPHAPAPDVPVVMSVDEAAVEQRFAGSAVRLDERLAELERCVEGFAVRVEVQHLEIVGARRLPVVQHGSLHAVLGRLTIEEANDDGN